MLLKQAEQKWLRLKDKWQARFPVSPDAPHLGSWLDAAPQGIGCRACWSAGRACSFGAYSVRSAAALQVVNFNKHAVNPRHLESVRRMLTESSGETEPAVGAAPSASEFEAVLDAASQPLGGSGKKKAMMWCLAEAMKSFDQAAMKEASAMSLFRDERKGLIAIRFRTVSPGLVQHSGTLGYARDAGTGAANLTKATLKIIQRACSRFANGPRIQARPRLLSKLYSHVRDSIHAIAVDAAQDEVTSAELMRSSWDGPALTPNLRFVLRDKAHSSRRITSRPWKCDPYLTETLDNFCHGRLAVAKLIQFSPEIRRIFEAEAAEESGSYGRIKNFRAAKHRFESHARPLGRTVLHLHACVRTALRVYGQGNAAPAKKAQEWLLWLNAEHCLQAAMLADAADSSLLLTRRMDSEALDPAKLSTDIAVYLSTINGLFVEGKCLTSFGYTKCMLELLRCPIVFQVGSKTRSLGSADGVPEDVQERCLDRMRAWVCLAKAAVEAEFPSFELAQAFRVFLLDGAQNLPPPDADLARIAGACGLDLALLSAQYGACRPHAACHYQELSKGCAGAGAGQDNKLAWKRALDEWGGSGRRPDLSVLRAALVQYCVVCPSSSGVEQAFSRGAWSFHCRRYCAHASIEEYCLKVCMDKDLRKRADVVRQARLVWSLCYGAPRQGALRRRDTGTTRPWARKRHAEAGFLRRRREADAQVAAAAAPPANAEQDTPLPADSWTEAHDKEFAFQVQKQAARKAQALTECALLPEEATPALQAAAAAAQARLLKNESERRRKRARQEAVHHGNDRSSVLAALRGKSAFLAVPASVELQEALSEHQIAQVASCERADIIVSATPGALDNTLLQAVSGVRGCCEICPNFLLEGFGAAVQVKAAGARPRALLVSKSCAASHARFFASLRTALPEGAPWAISKGALVKVLRSQQQYKAGEAYVVVTDTEKSGSKCRSLKNCFTVTALADKIWQADALLSHQGF